MLNRVEYEKSFITSGPGLSLVYVKAQSESLMVRESSCYYMVLCLLKHACVYSV